MVSVALLLGVGAFVRARATPEVRSAPPPSAGALWVSPAGDDSTCARGDRSRPCSTLPRAYALARPGDVVEVAAGEYGSQNFTDDNPALSPRSRVTFQPEASVSPSAIGIAYLNLIEAHNLVVKSLTVENRGDPRGGANPLIGRGAQGLVYVSRGSAEITLDNMVVHGKLRIEGGSNISILNSEVCCYLADSGTTVFGHPSIGSTVPTATQPTGILIENTSFHDIDSTSVNSHTECLQVLAVHGLTIKRSTFYRCNVSGSDGGSHGNSRAGLLFSGADCSSESTCGSANDYWDIVIEDSIFDGGTVGNRIGFQVDGQEKRKDCGDGDGDGRAFVFRRNHVVGTALFGCSPAFAPASEILVESNHFSLDNSAYGPTQCYGTFRRNVWDFGQRPCS